MRARRLRLYRGKMTPGEPLDDDVFINSNFLAKGPIHKAGVKTAHDRSSFFRIGSVTGRCSAEYGAIEATTGYVFRTEGLGSAESEGAGLATSITTATGTNRNAALPGGGESANRTATGADSKEKPCTNALTSRHAGSAGGG